MALTLKQLKMTPKRTELLEKMGLTDSDAILMCVPLRYQSREVIPYDQWQVKSEVILEGQIVRPARTMRIRGGKTMTKFQLESDGDWLLSGRKQDHSFDVQLAAAAGTAGRHAGLSFKGRHDAEDDAGNYQKNLHHRSITY